MQTTSGSTANELISIKDNINKIGSGKMIIEANGNGSKTGFFISRAELVFAELRQAFTLHPILHYFDPDCPS